LRKSLRMLGLIISFSLIMSMGYSVTFKTTLQQSKVFATEDANLGLVLKNDGARSLSDVLISVNLPQALGGQRNYTVKSIPAGSTYDRTVQIVTNDNTPIGNYTINSTLRYGGETIEYPNVVLEIAEFPLTIAYQFRKDSMKAGEENALVINVKNTADQELTNLDVSLDYPGGFITNMSRDLFFSRMDPRLELRQEFVFLAPADANGDYHIGITVAFKDWDGKSHSLTRYAKIYVAGSPGLSWLETLITIIIIILIGLILLGYAK